ncbi:T-cell surface glycoprotein CD3 epsilon chain isoform X2 [Chelonia mydas]|uniref:T-cell surface glycoprotein CD3 epsilon chain isoform X2 n=1 Tax=Chelonia mydas TaxID=8469 RepID=UPI0018A1C896|nr:T-cell surface glycoprotein CD3 epsilon chain isoform X2 [Chelonia mydas]XP_043390123.1 T-cell surface glycoprotein CD3 epsilon chain isoform X2 [Chelonia mydas]
MKLELALPVLGLLLCVADTVAQQNPFTVVISKTKVTLTCPLDEGVTWKKEGQDLKITDSIYEIEEYESSKNDGEYTCGATGNPLKLHLKAKVCESCEELDVLTVAGVIIADLLITLGVLILVYYFSKNRKGRVGGSAGVHPRGQKMVRPPPVPNPDYEPIRKGQREVYAGLQSRGF